MKSSRPPAPPPQSSRPGSSVTSTDVSPGVSNLLSGHLPTHMTADPLPWLQERLAPTPWSNQIPAIASTFSAAVSTASSEAVQDWSRRFGTIQEEFSKTGLQLIPSPYPSLAKCFWPLPHLLGLLSLGGVCSAWAHRSGSTPSRPSPTCDPFSPTRSIATRAYPKLVNQVCMNKTVTIDSPNRWSSSGFH
jgi:hypothetical protein